MRLFENRIIFLIIFFSSHFAIFVLNCHKFVRSAFKRTEEEEALYIERVTLIMLQFCLHCLFALVEFEIFFSVVSRQSFIAFVCFNSFDRLRLVLFVFFRVLFLLASLVARTVGMVDGYRAVASAHILCASLTFRSSCRLSRSGHCLLLIQLFQIFCSHFLFFFTSHFAFAQTNNIQYRALVKIENVETKWTNWISNDRMCARAYASCNNPPNNLNRKTEMKETENGKRSTRNETNRNYGQ